ncbi:MAG: transposase family protein, partial [Planctomycetaceae bacterium]|nr:transposase family protein [Planctomycetaceae bacterium]
MAEPSHTLGDLRRAQANDVCLAAYIKLVQLRESREEDTPTLTPFGDGISNEPSTPANDQKTPQPPASQAPKPRDLNDSCDTGGASSSGTNSGYASGPSSDDKKSVNDELAMIEIDPLKSKDPIVVAERENDLAMKAQIRCILEAVTPMQKQYYTKNGAELHLIDGVLVRRKHYGEKVVQLIMVPALYQYEILVNSHDLQGHRAVEKTYERARQKYDWPGMLTHIRDFVHSCDTCQHFNCPNPKLRLELKPIVSKCFNDIVQIDFEQLSQTKTGFTYMLVIVDHFTKWADAFPMKDTTAKAVANVIFERWICVHGPMRVLQSDQGPQFESRLFAQFNKRMGIVKVRSTAYHPQTNGLVERQNRTLIAMLRVYLSRYQDDWDEKLHIVLFAYRTAVHCTTKETPYRAVYGAEARTCLDWIFPQFSFEEGDGVNLSWDEILRRDIRAANEVVRANHGTAQRRQKQHFDKRIHGHADHQVASLVVIYVPQVPTGPNQVRKLRPRWVGPYEVIEVIGDRNYRVKVPGYENGKVVNWENTCKYDVRMGHLVFTDELDLRFEWDSREIWVSELEPFNEEQPGQVACDEEKKGVEPSIQKKHGLRDRAKITPPHVDDFVYGQDSFFEEDDENDYEPSMLRPGTLNEGSGACNELPALHVEFTNRLPLLDRKVNSWARVQGLLDQDDLDLIQYEDYFDDRPEFLRDWVKSVDGLDDKILPHELQCPQEPQRLPGPPRHLDDDDMHLNASPLDSFSHAADAKGAAEAEAGLGGERLETWVENQR